MKLLVLSLTLVSLLIAFQPGRASTCDQTRTHLLSRFVALDPTADSPDPVRTSDGSWLGTQEVSDTSTCVGPGKLAGDIPPGSNAFAVSWTGLRPVDGSVTIGRMQYPLEFTAASSSQYRSEWIVLDYGDATSEGAAVTAEVCMHGDGHTIDCVIDEFHAYSIDGDMT